jgi:hypothetical protein
MLACPSFRPFSFVSHVAQNLIDLESWNLTEKLISMCSCALGYFRMDKFSIFRVIVFNLVKIRNFQVVSLVAKKVLNIESWNLADMVLSMWSCAPWYFCVDIISLFGVIVLVLVKIRNFQLVSHIAKKVFDIES